MLSYVCNQRRDIDCTGGVNGSLSLSRIGQAIVALVTGWHWQTARKQLLQPTTTSMQSGKQASSGSGWAARFSSEVKVRCRRASHTLGPLRPHASHTLALACALDRPSLPARAYHGASS